jgi:YidC/Oxa1 family membrane protein insertase
MIAVALSFVFFLGYTTIFPPAQQVLEDQNRSTLSVQSTVQNKTHHEVSELPALENSTTTIQSSNTLVHVEANNFSLDVDTLGRISSKILKEDKYSNKEHELTQLVSAYGTKPLHIRFSDSAIDAEAMKIPYSASVSTIDLKNSAKAEVILTQKLSDVTVTKVITFYVDGHYDVNIKLSNEKRYFVYLGQRAKSGDDQMMTVQGALVYDGEGLTTIFEDEDVEGRATFSNVKLISAFGQYVASIIYNLERDVNVLVDRDRESNPVVYFDAKPNISFSGYLGPKDYATLKALDPVLVNAIEYGFFTFIAAPMFSVLFWLHGIIGNWGWAIIALTFIIRMLMFPLTYKGMVSMQKMKEIAPRIKELQTKYKGDPQRMNAAVMEMYKKHGANPVGGCLPMLLQIPVFFAIYRVLLNAVELQGASWLVWSDLSRMDPWFVLPILMGATMWYQQHITPNNFTDPMQAKVFKWLPVIFTFFFITFPAGLVLYWLVNNVFSIAQQFLVNKQFETAKEERHQKHLAEKHHDKD